MSILTRPSSPVKPTRPRGQFGAGILDDAPKPVRLRDDRPRPKPPAPKPTPQPAPAPKVPAWKAAVREYLTSVGCGPADVEAALSWINARRCVGGCPAVPVPSWPLVDAILKANAEPTPQVLAVEAALASEPIGSVPAASWGPDTDEYRWTLTPAALATLDRRVPAYEPAEADEDWRVQTEALDAMLAAGPRHATLAERLAADNARKAAAVGLVSTIIAPAAAWRFDESEPAGRIDRWASRVTDEDMLSRGQND